MKKKGERGYIINDKRKRVYAKNSEYIDIDSFNRELDYSFTIK